MKSKREKSEEVRRIWMGAIYLGAAVYQSKLYPGKTRRERASLWNVLDELAAADLGQV